jgi:two-component system OmpR family response regulator
VKHVLAVDDDPAIRAMIADYLADNHFRVSTAASGGEMARALKAEPVDLVILDVQLDDEDGLELVRDLRTRSALPIIVLSGHRRDEVDRVIGLELGADDYLTKPVSLRELLARIRAALRRAEAASPAGPDDRRTRYRFAGWELSMRTRRLKGPNDDVVALTKGEFSLLAAFLEAPQRVLSREQLLAASRLHDAEVYDRSIDVQILRLRRKLESNPSDPRLIRTERGMGYVFAAPVEIL